MQKRLWCGLLTGLWLTIGLPLAYAADTVETYDEGAVDFEFYAGADALNLDKYEKAVYASLSLGYGLLPGFSGYLALGAESDEYLTTGEGAYSFGLIGTPLDTDHVDLDLLLDVGMGGEALNQIGVTPGLELNFDLKPDLQLWGVYLRAEDAMYGRDESAADDPTTADVDETETKHVLASALGLTAGTYVTVADGHQLVGEYCHTYYAKPAPEELRWDSDGFALGYNVGLVDNLELITQVNCHPGHDHQDATWGASLGFIVTIPRAPAKPEKPE